MGRCRFLLEHLFNLSHRQNPLDHVNEQRKPYHRSFRDLELHGRFATFFPWCKLKWSQDEFNSQSQILQDLGMTSWSIV